MFCVEGPGQRRGCHVSRLSAVPEGENSQAAGSSSSGHSRACTQVLPRARGPGGPSTSLFGQPRVPADDYRQINQVVRSSSLRNMEASPCADAFIVNWVARFGVPATVTTDRGAQFTSPLWKAACTSMGIKHVLTTAYHPQSNGIVELVHRQLKDALRARGAGPAWYSHLSWVLMGLRAAPKEDSAVSSAELVTGTPLVLPGHLMHEPNPPRVDMPPPPTRPTSYGAAATTPPAHLAQVDHVYVVRACWRPTEAGGGLKCWPIPGGLQGGQELYNPGRPEARDHLSGPSEGPHRPRSSVSFRGHFSRPSSQDAGRSCSPACTFVKM
jgi:hypothetical protein